MEIRRSYNCLISTMGFPILLRPHLYIESGARSAFQYIGIPMLKIRRSHDRLIFNMGIPVPGKDGLYIETGPWSPEATLQLCSWRDQCFKHNASWGMEGYSLGAEAVIEIVRIALYGDIQTNMAHICSIRCTENSWLMLWSIILLNEL